MWMLASEEWLGECGKCVKMGRHLPCICPVTRGGFETGELVHSPSSHSRIQSCVAPSHTPSSRSVARLDSPDVGPATDTTEPQAGHRTAALRPDVSGGHYDPMYQVGMDCSSTTRCQTGAECFYALCMTGLLLRMPILVQPLCHPPPAILTWHHLIHEVNLLLSRLPQPAPTTRSPSFTLMTSRRGTAPPSWCSTWSRPRRSGRGRRSCARSWPPR